MPKSKLGCTTCRRRKVKCDEEFPTCQQCRKAARPCDGPFRHKFVYVDPRDRHETSIQLPQQCSAVLFSHPAEARTFSYFLSKVAPELGGDLDADFWTVLLPQISHEDRAIRDALLAISHLYEQPPFFPQTSGQNMKRASVSRWYLRSLSEFRSRITVLQCRTDYQLALLSCLLFTNIEFQQNHVLNACNLLKCGLSLISNSYREEGRAFDMSDSITKTTMQSFARHRFLMTLYGHPASNNPFETFAGTHCDNLSFVESLKEARECLYDCLNDLVLLLQTARTAEKQQLESQDYLTLCKNRQSLLRKLDLWYNRFVQHWVTIQASLASRERSAAHVMTIYCEIAFVWVHTCLQPEVAADQHMERFERILDLAEVVTQQRHEKGISSVKYSPEMGVIAPLFFTGWKCRDPRLRRRALSLLCQAPQQETLYSAEMHAKALKAVIDIEEGHVADSSNLERKRESCLPSEEARVRNLTVHYETWAGVKVAPALIYQQIRHRIEGIPTWVEQMMLL